MIINHNYKFIFVHIHKTAGTSIKEALLKLDGSSMLAYHHTHLSWIDYSRYNDYYKFCFVRNPWDRLVSWYFGILKLKTKNNFQSYIKANSNDFSSFLDCKNIVNEKVFSKKENFNVNFLYFKSISYNQLDYISDEHNNILTNFIGRFENLESDWKKVMNHLGLSLVLPKKNIGHHMDFRSYYKQVDIEKVNKIYERDINYFGYSFN